MKNVKIIIADIRQSTEDAKQNLSQIAPYYVEKYMSAKIKKVAGQELVSGYLLNKYLGIDQDEQITYNEYKKPSPATGSIFFNLSHSEDYVVLAISDCNVGVDVEKIGICHEATVKKIFSTKQKEELSCLEGDAKNEAFFRMWTACEAMLKLKGTGFGEEWDKDVPPVENCRIYTERFNDYILSCATEAEVTITIEKL